MGKYINPFTDIGFKRIFGQELSRPLLLDFLNNLLKGERVIEEITFLDKEQPAEFEHGRSLIYDIFCKTDSGEHIIVEMQNREQPYFKKRSIYYTAEAIARQGERGVDWRYSISAVYFVGFLNFRLDDIGEKFRTDVALMDIEERKLFSGDMRMIFLQLPYFKKEAEECADNFERWIYVLKHMEALNRLPWTAKDPIFERLAQISEISALTRDERIKYDAAIRYYRDNAHALEDAEEVGERKGWKRGHAAGVQQGMQQGMREGMQQGFIETAKKLKAMGMSTSDIHIVTGLLPEDIDKL